MIIGERRVFVEEAGTLKMTYAGLTVTAYNFCMTSKTLAMKLLEKKKVDYTAHTYPTTERDAEKIAVHFGVKGGEVFKTLVVYRPKKPLLIMLAANKQLDLKKLAKSVGEKKLKMATHAEAERLTGLQVGGISPLALLNKGFVMLADASISEQERVFISSGERGINLNLPVKDLLKITRAKVVDVAS